MAEILPNQPIIFNQSENCWLEDSGLKVLAEYGDITQFQMGLEPCGTDLPMIQNGELTTNQHWTTSSSIWTIGGGVAVKTAGVGGSFYQAAQSAIGVVVRVRFDIVIAQGEINLSWGGNTNYITQSGSYEFWLERNNTSTDLSFSATASTICTISNIEMISVNTNYKVNIVNDSGTIVDTLEKSDGYFTFADGYFTVSIDWETLAIPDGCYTLQVIDPCPCANGGIVALDFYSSTFEWSISNGGWTIGSGSADFNGSSSSAARLAKVLCVDTTYEVTYTVTGLSATEEFYVQLGTQQGTTRTSDGTYTEQITADGNDIFRIVGNPTAGTAVFSVTDLSIEAVDPEPAYISNTIKLQQEFNCTTLGLTLCNDSDGLGFGFENTGFRPLMRIPASLNRSSYPMERLSYDNSIGRKATYYARSRKARELGFDGLEFMHDFAHLFGMADHFYIEGTEYFVEDDEYPSISWAENDDQDN